MTLVSSLLLQRNGQMSHDLQKYINNFKYITDLNIDVVLFLDKNINISLPKNVHVLNTSIEDLEAFKILNTGNRKILKGEGVSYNPSKNTLDYMIIQNAKNEFLYKATNKFNLESVAWIDFGAAHMFKTPEATIKKLLLIDNLKKGIVIPGCWEKNAKLNDINWRFCGTFLNLDKDSARNIYEISYKALEELKDIAIWEVNIWAWIEINKSFNFFWYKANHDDSLFNFEEYLNS